MKLLNLVFFASLILSSQLPANEKIEDDCEKEIHQKVPSSIECKTKYNTDKLADRPRRINCYLEIVEAGAHNCLKLNNPKERNDCIVEETIKINKTWSEVCVNYFRADYEHRLESKEKTKFGGKSSFEINTDKQKAAKAAKTKQVKKDPNAP